MTEHLQINDVAPRIQYVCDGIQAAFIYPFAVFRTADLEVWRDGARVSAGFSVSGAGVSSGGVVLFTVPPAQGSRLTLRRRVALERVSDFQTDGIIRAKTLNDELDYQVAAVQQVADDVARCLRRPFTSPSTADLSLPEPVPGRTIKWAVDGLSLVNSVVDPDAQVVAAQSAAELAGIQAAQAVAAAQTAAQSAAWAEKTDGPVDGIGLSAKAHAQSAAASAAAAAASAAGLNLPAATGHGGHFLRQKTDCSGLEYRSPEQVAADLGVGEQFQDLGSGTSLVLDGNGKAALRLVMTGTTTLSSANLSAGKVHSFLLWLAQDAVGARAFVLPGNTKWPYGEVPQWPTAAGKYAIFCLSTWDAGANWQGSFVGAEYA